LPLGVGCLHVLAALVSELSPFATGARRSAVLDLRTVGAVRERLANAYVTDIRENGVSVYDSGFQVIDQSPSPIEVSIHSGGSTVRGIVRDANQKAVVTARVVIVPQSPRRGNTALFKTVLSGRDGTFALTAVPPGEYKLFAWFDVLTSAPLNPEFLSKYEAQGQAITILPNTNIEQQLTAIPDEAVR